LQSLAGYAFPYALESSKFNWLEGICTPPLNSCTSARLMIGKASPLYECFWTIVTTDRAGVDVPAADGSGVDPDFLRHEYSPDGDVPRVVPSLNEYGEVSEYGS